MGYDPRNLPSGAEELFTPGEVAAMFRVGRSQVARWARDGKLSTVRTIGNHRRYRASEVRALMDSTRRERTS